MAEFSGKIVDAYYFDEDYTTIEVIYKNDNDEMISYVLEADTNHPDYQDLVSEGWTTEKVAAATVEYKRQQSTAFNEAIQKQVDEIINTSKKELDKLKKQKASTQKEIDNEVFDLLLKTNENSDTLFKFKLWLLEQPDIKKADRAVKTKIRKAKSIVEGFAILNEVLQDNE